MSHSSAHFVLGFLFVVVCCVCDVWAGDGDYYNICSGGDQSCTGPHAQCCLTGSNNEGECINNQTYTCAVCAGGGNAICGFGENCCAGPQDCYSPTENRCCTSAASPFVCHANDTCCASVCCANGMACTAEGVCMDYPKEPLCGQPCLSDSDCGYGGSSCGTCYGFYTAGDPVAAKICVVSIVVPSNTAGTQALAVPSGESTVLTYSATPFSASVLQVTAQATRPECAASMVSQQSLFNLITPSNTSTINVAYTNVRGGSVGPGNVWVGLDYYANENCSATGSYMATTTPFPTSGLQIDENSWTGNASTGQLFSFPLNGLSTLFGVQQPFVVSVAQMPGGNCVVVPTLTYAGAPSGSQLWQNPVSNLFVPISLYGGAFNASWTVVVYIMSGSCELIVGAQNVPSVDFGAFYSFTRYVSASYVGCDPTGSSQCNGFTLSGPFVMPTYDWPPAIPTTPPAVAPMTPPAVPTTPPAVAPMTPPAVPTTPPAVAPMSPPAVPTTPPTAPPITPPATPPAVVCVTVMMEPQNQCFVLFNGAPIPNGVTITQPMNARVDVFVNSSTNANIACSGIVATAEGPCPSSDEERRAKISIV